MIRKELTLIIEQIFYGFLFLFPFLLHYFYGALYLCNLLLITLCGFLVILGKASLLYMINLLHCVTLQVLPYSVQFSTWNRYLHMILKQVQKVLIIYHLEKYLILIQ